MAGRGSVDLALTLLSSILSALSSFLIVPVCVKYLGPESYGLLGVFSSTQVILQLLDLGLGPTVNREVAQMRVKRDTELGTLIRSGAAISWFIATVVAACFIAASRWLAGHWFTRSTLTQSSIATAISWMGIVLATRWPISLYQQALMGAGSIRVVSKVSATVALLGLGVVPVLRFASSSLSAYFAFQFAVAIFQILVYRAMLGRELGDAARGDIRVSIFRSRFAFSGGIVALNLAGIVFTQLDKVLLLRMIPLSEFGYYSMAFTAANSLAFIFSAFYSNAYPRFSSRIAANEPEAGQLVLYRQYTVTLATIMTSVGFFLAAFGYPFVYAWTRSQSVALHVGPLFSLLVIGTAVHGIMYIPHAYQLAAGTTRIALTLNMSLALMQVPLILLLTSRFGSVGAAAAWLTLHIAYCLLGTVLMHRRFFRGHGLDWLVRDVGVPALVSACAAVLARLVVASTLEPVTRLFIGGGIGVLTLGTLVAWQPPVRELFVELFSARVRVAR